MRLFTSYSDNYVRTNDIDIPTSDALVPEDRVVMSQYAYTPAPRIRGGDYRLDDDTALVMQRSGPINKDLSIIQDYATDSWSADEMVYYYNISKSALISKGLITAMQLYTICRGVGAKCDEVDPDNMAIVVSFWKDQNVQQLCIDSKISKDDLADIGLKFAYRFYNDLLAADIEHHIIVETMAYNSRGHGMTLKDAYNKAVSYEKRMKLLNDQQTFEMFGMQYAV